MKENIESVLQLLRRLQPILTRRAISKICENSNEKPYLTDVDIVEMFTSEKVVGWELDLILFYDVRELYIDDSSFPDEPRGEGGPAQRAIFNL